MKAYLASKRSFRRGRGCGRLLLLAAALAGCGASDRNAPDLNGQQQADASAIAVASSTSAPTSLPAASAAAAIGPTLRPPSAEDLTSVPELTSLPATVIPHADQLATAPVAPTNAPASSSPMITRIIPIATAVRRLPTPAPTERQIDAWQTYRNDKAGYSAEYPISWRVAEQIAADGTGTTIFTPHDSGATISVLVRSGPPDAAGPLPAATCTQPQPGRMTPARCLATISANPPKTIAGHGKTYTIVTSEGGVEPNVYQHFVNSFSLLSP